MGSHRFFDHTGDFDDRFGAQLTTVHDVCHDLAKHERRAIEGTERRRLVHARAPRVRSHRGTRSSPRPTATSAGP